MKAFSWINFVLGLWLIVAAFALSPTARPVMTEEIVLGVIIACLALASTVRPLPILSWLVAIAGLWTLVAPMVMKYGILRVSRGNDILVGIIVLALGVSNAIYRQEPVRTHA